MEKPELLFARRFFLNVIFFWLLTFFLKKVTEIVLVCLKRIVFIDAFVSFHFVLREILELWPLERFICEKKKLLEFEILNDRTMKLKLWPSIVVGSTVTQTL